MPQPRHKLPGGWQGQLPGSQMAQLRLQEFAAKQAADARDRALALQEQQMRDKRDAERRKYKMFQEQLKLKEKIEQDRQRALQQAKQRARSAGAGTATAAAAPKPAPSPVSQVAGAAIPTFAQLLAQSAGALVGGPAGAAVGGAVGPALAPQQAPAQQLQPQQPSPVETERLRRLEMARQQMLRGVERARTVPEVGRAEDAFAGEQARVGEWAYGERGKEAKARADAAEEARVDAHVQRLQTALNEPDPLAALTKMGRIVDLSNPRVSAAYSSLRTQATAQSAANKTARDAKDEATAGKFKAVMSAQYARAHRKWREVSRPFVTGGDRASAARARFDAETALANIYDQHRKAAMQADPRVRNALLDLAKSKFDWAVVKLGPRPGVSVRAMSAEGRERLAELMAPYQDAAALEKAKPAILFKMRQWAVANGREQDYFAAQSMLSKTFRQEVEALSPLTQQALGGVQKLLKERGLEPTP